MKEFIEKLIGRLEEEMANFFIRDSVKMQHYQKGLVKAIEIVNQLAEEYGKDTNVATNGWFPTAEMLFPRYGQKVFASVKCEDCKHEIIITKYERQEYWHNGIIIAWQPLPAPYQKKGEHDNEC